MPFDGDTTSITTEEPSIENDQDRIAVYGNVDPAHDKAGLRRARGRERML